MIILNRRFSPSWLMVIITCAGVCLFVSLGLWQLDRAALKEAIQMKFEARLDADYRHFKVGESLSDIEFQKVILRGQYDSGRSMLVDNRLDRGQAGYQVLTPFKLSDSEKIVLVNRGWVVLGDSRAQLPVIEAPAADGVVRGIASIPDLDGYRMGEVSLEDKWPQVIPFIDINAMQSRFQNRLLPMVLWLDPAQPGHYQRRWNPVWSDPEKSRAYAWQWFAFAAISVILFISLNLHRVNNE